MANLFDIVKGRKARVAIVSKGRELLKIDATISESHGMSAQATSQSIEDGSEISDHIIRGNRTLSLTGLISDSPIDLAEVAVGNLAGITGSIFEVFGASAAITGLSAKIGSSLISDGKGKPSKSAFEALENIYNDSLLVEIVTGLKTYSNMAMESLNIPRRADINEALEFTATFRQVIIAISKTEDVPKEVIKAGTPKTATNKIKEGNKAAVEASEEINNKLWGDGSIAFELGKRLGVPGVN